jgi:hypothetical protein
MKSQLQLINDLVRNTASGYLDAKKIGKVFGLTITDFSRQINVPESLLESPICDMDVLEDFLTPYENIAQLRLVLSDEEFKNWLHAPNDLLENQNSPMDYIKSGATEQVVAVVQNMLAGSTT